MHVRGLVVNREDVMVWSGRKLAVYAFSQDKPTIRDAGTVNDGDQSTSTAAYMDSVCALYPTTVGVHVHSVVSGSSCYFMPEELFLVPKVNCVLPPLISRCVVLL